MIRFDNQLPVKLKIVSYYANSMLNKYHCRIYVTLRSSVLDPAGTAVESGLQQLGYNGVENVRIGKYIELYLSATDETEAKTQVDQMCDQLLANTVIENYCFELTNVSATVEV